METLMKMDGIVRTYTRGNENIRALDGVSLAVSRGELVAVVGASGSGKSTLMNMLGCLDVADEGRYLLGGRDVFSMSDKALSAVRNREIGFIFQGFNLVGGLTALENVELPLIYRGVSASKRRTLAETALEKVALSHRMHHKPSELSGGQQQRVAIARALASEPPIILADEPTGNLDSTTGAEVMRMLKALNRNGKTIIIITHDDNVAACAQRIISIKDGKIA